jgi:hypothetical protein
MKNEIIELVRINFDLVKKNKIDFETKLVKEIGIRDKSSKYEIQKEIDNIKNLFIECNTPEEVVDVICEKDFCDCYNDEYFDDLYNNINNLITNN